MAFKSGNPIDTIASMWNTTPQYVQEALSSQDEKKSVARKTSEALAKLKEQEKAKALLASSTDFQFLMEAQKIVVDDAAYVYLFQRSTELAMRASVQGYAFNPMLEQIYDFAAMSKAQ